MVLWLGDFFLVFDQLYAKQLGNTNHEVAHNFLDKLCVCLLRSNWLRFASLHFRIPVGGCIGLVVNFVWQPSSDFPLSSSNVRADLWQTQKFPELTMTYFKHAKVYHGQQ